MMAGFNLHSVCARCRHKKKSADPCIGTPPATCSHCDALTAEQKAQLSTPSYKLKKEKKEAKLSTPAKASDTLSPTLVDPALVSVVGVVDGQTTSGLSGPAEKKKKTESKKSSSSTSKSTKPEKSVKSSSHRPSSSATDQSMSTTSSADAYCLPAPECCRFRSVYRFLSVAGPGALLVTEESVVPASNPVLTTGLPVPECCRFRRVAGSGTGVLLVTRNLLFPSLLARNHLQIQC